MNIEFSSTNPSDLFQIFAKQLSAEVNDNTFTLKKHAGNGFAIQIVLESGLILTLFDFKLNTAVKATRAAEEDGIYFPIICWLSSAQIEQEIQGDKKLISKHSPYGIFFPSPNIESKYLIPSNTHNIILTITITKDWLQTNLSGKNESNLLNLMESKKPFFLFEDISFQMSRYLECLKELDNRNLVTKIQIRSHVLNFLALFISKIEGRKSARFSSNISQVDVEKLFQVKQVIDNYFSNPQKIKTLAEGVAISESKLQKLFSEVFGITIYQYTLKVRIEAAKKMLESKKYSVSDVGYEVGYTNLSHFTSAFKKQVGINPKQYLSNL